jgi:hypothetical protein
MAGGDVGKAIELIKRGNKKEGKEILVDILEKNQQNDIAWAWLHVCVSSTHEKIYCLERFLELSPKNEGARAELAKLKGKPYKESEKDIIKKVKHEQTHKTKQKSIKKQPKSEPTKSLKYKKPTIIFNKPDENLFSDEKRTTTSFHDIDAGMYGNRFTIGDLVITPFDYPDCIDDGHLLERSNCDVCEFFGYDDCPIRHDPDILLDVRTIFTGQKRYWVVSEERRQSMVEAVYTELKYHGRPLHYDMLAKIVKGQYPFLGISPLKVLYLMERHPEKFECVDQGVYRVK